MKKMLRIAYAITLLILSWFSSSAQEFSVRGKVTSQLDNSPLAGATIKLKGSSKSVSADDKGNFVIKVPNGSARLEITYVGYTSQEISIDNRTEITVALQPSESKGENEVIVVGYGTQRKSDLTGSIASVSAEKLRSVPMASIEQGLQGRLPGVVISQTNSSPGGALSIRVRGGNSILGGNEPLYVIDGFPIYNTTSEDATATQASNPLASINPNDIESIQVLKDASATAIYGSRGANGVIIITTKRGRSGQANVDVDVYHGVQQVGKKLKLLTPKEYAEFANEKAANTGLPAYFPDLNNLPGATDWQDEIFNQAPISNYSLTFSGGNPTNKFLVSTNYFDQGGIIKNSDYKRGSIRLNLDNKINNWLSVSTSVIGSHSVNNRARTSIFSGAGVVYSALIAPPVAPVFAKDSSYYRLSNLPTADPGWVNPRAFTDGYTNTESVNRFLGNTNLEFSLLDGLKFSVRLGIDYNEGTIDSYSNRIYQSQESSAVGGSGFVNKSSYYNYLNENILSYSKIFNRKHNLNLTGGFTYQKKEYSSLGGSASGFVVDINGTNNLGSGSVANPPTTNRGSNTILSWLGRANYVFNNKYLLTLSARADGSSRLGEGKKWSVFPSGAFGWKVSEENFMQPLDFVSNLKFRVSYGTTGNQEIGDYNSLSKLQTVTALFGPGSGTRTIGFAPGTLENPDLKWEVTKQADIGFDLGLFNQRLDFTFDYYHKNTSDLLALVPLALSSGYASVLTNFGEMQNKGFELGLNTTVIKNNNVTWSLGGNFSKNKNKVLKVASKTGEIVAGDISSPFSSSVNKVKEGYSLSSFFGYKTNGLWETNQTTGSIQPSAKAGDQRYVDADGNGSIGAGDKVYLGKPDPDFTYGLNSSVTYRNFDLNVLFQGAEGNTLVNVNKYSIADNFGRMANQLAEEKDRWTSAKPNVNAKYPRLSNVGPLVSDRFFEDGSYLRLKNINLGYTFPSNVKWLKSTRIYVSAQNLVTWTKYTGYDPEAASFGATSLIRGVDVGAYPSAKTFIAGIKLGL